MTINCFTHYATVINALRGSNYIHKLLGDSAKTIVKSKGDPRDTSPSFGPISFISMQLLAKILSNTRFRSKLRVPPVWKILDPPLKTDLTDWNPVLGGCSFKWDQVRFWFYRQVNHFNNIQLSFKHKKLLQSNASQLLPKSGNAFEHVYRGSCAVGTKLNKFEHVYGVGLVQGWGPG